MLGVGAALLVGGWGITRYADEQQSIYTGAGSYARLDGWDEGLESLPASKTIYAAGVVTMAIGAGLIGFSALPGDSK